MRSLRFDGRELQARKRVGWRGDIGDLWEKGGSVPPKERDVDHWLNLAEQAQVHAEQMTNATAKREMLKVAAAYRLLADAERTARKRA